MIITYILINNKYLCVRINLATISFITIILFIFKSVNWQVKVISMKVSFTSWVFLEKNKMKFSYCDNA